MKCIMVMFDTLNRRHLPPYGCDWIHAPNFQRLAERSVTFDQSYVCSMPCMPARRDFHTGRPNFLHRSWGPIEPFDDSVPQMLKEAGVHSTLITDHQHYWEDGGSTYHNRYSSYRFFRGQEGDRWMGQVDDPAPAHTCGRNSATGGAGRQDRINRSFMTREQDQPQAKTFAAGLDFIRRNAHADRWFCQVETFDPHEPFFTQRHYQDLYRDQIGDRSHSPLCDWPNYGKCHTDSREIQDQIRGHYAALISMCDKHLGDVLDTMDDLNLWNDTMLVVWTDHGFLLGEHDLWAKCHMPFYDEMAHTPFFVWDPRSRKNGKQIAGQRRQSLVQPSIDLGPTLLDFFGLQPTEHMTGKVLRDTITDDTPVRDAAMFGIHGGQLNVTDGRYVYMHAPADEQNGPLFDYTLMPTHMRSLFSPEILAQAELHDGFSFTKGAKVLKVPLSGVGWMSHREHGVFDTMLFDLETDPRQERPYRDEVIEQRLIDEAVDLMREAEAPPEQYERLGLSEAATASAT